MAEFKAECSPVEIKIKKLAWSIMITHLYVAANWRILCDWVLPDIASYYYNHKGISIFASCRECGFSMHGFEKEVQVCLYAVTLIVSGLTWRILTIYVCRWWQMRPVRVRMCDRCWKWRQCWREGAENYWTKIRPLSDKVRGQLWCIYYYVTWPEVKGLNFYYEVISCDINVWWLLTVMSWAKF